MCCGPVYYPHWGHHGPCAPGWFHFGPHFLTKEEKVTWLERYLKGLQTEVKEVEKRLAELKK